jgi:energy-coupling factor transporter ATP-binding protein EcfA2
MLDFFKDERGITAETLAAFGVEVEGDTAKFTYPHGIKYRKHEADGTRKFWSEPKGVKLGLFGIRELFGERTMFLVEGETDAMRLWQELTEAGVENFNVVSIPGINAWEGDFSAHFAQSERIFVVLDNDEDYKVRARVDAAWLQIRKTLGRKAKRVELPADTKDVCEFFDEYTLDGFRLLCEEEARTYHYNALDLSTHPGPVDWMVENLLAKGDLALLIGEPGVGKSWLSMALAVAVAEQQAHWLGRLIHTETPRVLYVDEENPEGLVIRRLRRLGLTSVGEENIRFLHRQGIRLDRKPELLLDEALDWGPSLIVLDSLTRMHTGDENNAGEVARLFNDGINPLARETGATTLLLHHVTKTESSSSFARARGSGDISASVDSGLDVRSTDLQGGFAVGLYKSRWIEEGQFIRAHRIDNGDFTELQTDENRRVF